MAPQVSWTTTRHIVCVIMMLCGCVFAVPARAQQQELPEDHEDEKQIGLWLDQGISTSLSANKSLDVEFHERFDEGASNLFEYFFQGGLAFRVRPWFTLIPIYRYQRFPGNPTIAYENRVQLNLTLSTSRGPWRPTLRTLIEGRFVDNRPASARLRFRPGIEYTLPLRISRRPVLVLSNEFFVVPGNNPFANGGSSYTQNRFQVGVRLPIADSFSVRPYYLLQSVNLPGGWDTNEIFGISIALRIPRKTKTVRSRQPGSNLADEIAQIKDHTIPATGRLSHEWALLHNDSGIEESWQIDMGTRQDEYFRWIRSQFGPEYQTTTQSTTRIVMVKRMDCDTYTLTIDGNPQTTLANVKFVAVAD